MSNFTLELIRNSQVGTPGYTPATRSVTPVPTTPRPVPARRTETRGAYHPQVAMSRPSEPQKDLIKSLLDEITALSPQVGEIAREESNRKFFANELTPGWGNGASQWIDSLRASRDTLKATLKTQAPRVARPTLPEGSYAVTAEAGHTAFYRVEVSKRGYYTVSLQVSDDFQKLDWAHSQAVIAQIEADGPLEAAKRYGRELGTCPKCRRTLTNPASIAAGIGPVCQSKYM